MSACVPSSSTRYGRARTNLRLRTLAVSMIAAATLLGIPGLVVAAPAPEVEPNDNVFQLNGPSGPGGLAGSVASRDDVDYWLVQLRPQRQILIRLETTCQFRDSIYGDPIGFKMYPRLGGDAILNSSVEGDTPVREEAITTPGIIGGPSQLFVLEVRGSDYTPRGCPYNLTMSDTNGLPTDVFDPTPLPVLPLVTPPEPNDSIAQAFGPLNTSSLYSGSFETRNDSDYLVTRLKPGSKATIELGSVGDRGTGIEFQDGDGKYIDSEYVDSGGVRQFEVQAPASGVVVVKLTPFSEAAGAAWQLKLLPGAAFPTPVVPRAAPIRAALASAKVSGRRLVTKVRLKSAGRLQVLLVRNGRRIGIGKVTVSGPRTVTIAYRRPNRVRAGLYTVEIRFTAAGRPVGISRRRVLLS